MRESIVDNKWIPYQVEDKEVFQQLKNDLKIHSVLVQLLINRNIRDFESAKSFFRPNLSMLHDPFLMKDVEKAVQRINQAMDNKERILVYGDYDVDGTTAVAVMYGFLHEHYKEVLFYIPDRYKEGYGISYAGIDYAKSENCSLIIALDCGIKAIEKVDYAKEKGIDFIICDHHTPGETLPDAVAVLDPKRKDCEYPYKELSGCGVGFKLIQALLVNWNEPQEKAYKYLEILAISIAADMVSITGENRVLCSIGLQHLSNSQKPGIKALLEVGKINGEVSVGDIGFKIGPRINAAGRMDHGKKAVGLLISDSDEFARLESDEMDQANEARKEEEQITLEQAIEQLESDPEFHQKKSIVVYSPDWHKGIVGIVASRLVERYYKPTIVLTDSKDKVAGSARSVKGFSIYEAIGRCEKELIQFGGHMYAAGMTMERYQVAGFKKAFEKSVSEHISDNLLQPELLIEGEIQFVELSETFISILKQMGPFGQDNPSPLFLSKNVFDVGGARVVGDKHLKLTIRDSSSSQEFAAIAFGKGHLIQDVLNGQNIDIVYTIEENVYKGVRSLQLDIKDIRL